MKIGAYETHPAAELFPMLGEADLHALAESIKANGLHQSIVLCDGLILDGRNRALACELAGVEPRVTDFAGGNPWEYVWDLNAERRHLEPSQKAALAIKQERASAEWEAEQRRKREEANKGRSESQKGKPKGRARSTERTRSRGEKRDKGAKEIAAKSKVSTATVKRMLELQRKAPEKFEAVCRGDLLGRKALDQVKLQEKYALAERLRAEPVPLPEGPFRVITIDPPWPYELRKDDCTHHGRTPYPAMPIKDICALPVQRLAHPDGCVLWLWTTNTFMPDAFTCLEAWGFTHKTILTWDKCTTAGLGSYLLNVTEHCILAVRGKPTLSLQNQTTIIRETKREHSRKPEAFFTLVDSLCPGSKLEMFAREKRDGWAAWGNEAPGAAEAAA